MTVVEIDCIACGKFDVIKNVKSSVGEQRYRCKSDAVI